MFKRGKGRALGLGLGWVGLVWVDLVWVGLVGRGGEGRGWFYERNGYLSAVYVVERGRVTRSSGFMPLRRLSLEVRCSPGRYGLVGLSHHSCSPERVLD